MATARTDHSPDPTIYDARYYGHALPYRANYVDYQDPHWAVPLAQFLARFYSGPFLDLGCAFGHLVRELRARGAEALGVEWSDYAYARRVTDHVLHRDGRATLLPAQSCSTVISLDYLEHFPPEGPGSTRTAIAEIARLLRPGGYAVSLVGAPVYDDVGAETTGHYLDPTHLNHEPVAWYREAFAAAGFTLDRSRTINLNHHPLSRSSDWTGRWLVYWRPPWVGQGLPAEVPA